MGKTFLRWAGGKHWLVNAESHRFPTTYNRYIEPFLGGGAVFFCIEPRNAILSDVMMSSLKIKFGYCFIRWVFHI